LRPCARRRGHRRYGCGVRPPHRIRLRRTGQPRQALQPARQALLAAGPRREPRAGDQGSQRCSAEANAMTIEQAIYNYLTAAPRSLTVYPVRLPQEPPLPAVTYTRVATPMIRTIRGGKVFNPVFQLDCWAASYAGAKGLAASVRDALDG